MRDKVPGAWVFSLGLTVPHKYLLEYIGGAMSNLDASRSVVKRLLDLLVSSAAIVLTSPFLLLIALAIKSDSAGPVLFKQTRVGRDLVTFTMLKFRTMEVGDAGSGEILVGDDPYEARQRYKTTTENDARITKVGRVLRRYHLDELPQLVNVMMGSMSLVGPRPDVPAQVVDYSIIHWQQRHRVRPGLTGLSQVMQSSPKFSPKLRTALDLHYIRKGAGPCLDISIFGRTLLKVLGGSSF